MDRSTHDWSGLDQAGRALLRCSITRQYTLKDLLGHVALVRSLGASSSRDLSSPDFDLDPGRSFCGDCERFCGTLMRADRPSHSNWCGDGVAGVGSLGHGPASLTLGPGFPSQAVTSMALFFSLFSLALSFPLRYQWQGGTMAALRWKKTRVMHPQGPPVPQTKLPWQVCPRILVA